MRHSGIFASEASKKYPGSPILAIESIGFGQARAMQGGIPDKMACTAFQFFLESNQV